MGHQINYMLEAFHNKRDHAGNVYWGFIYYDFTTGKQVCATISGGESNISMIPFYLNGGSYEPHDCLFKVTELPIRRFNRMVKDWEYAGCRSDDLAEYIRQQLKK